jgi:hypothetical protein
MNYNKMHIRNECRKTGIRNRMKFLRETSGEANAADRNATLRHKDKDNDDDDCIVFLYTSTISKFSDIHRLPLRDHIRELLPRSAHVTLWAL